jgi:CRP-like cAMP-binding protein/ribonuclease BN (tRNA processing enzyme)
VLAETMSGPPDAAAYGAASWLRAECSAVSYYDVLGRSPRVDDMAELVSLEAGGGLAGVTISLEDDSFVFSEEGVVVARVPYRASGTPLPLTLAPPRPLLRQELTLQFIGGSDGFDPSGITTCFLAYLSNTPHARATLFDTAAFLGIRLGNLGISPSQISEVVLTHLHEDHLAGLPELVLTSSSRVRLITASMIYKSLLRVLSALLAVSEADVADLFDHYPLDPGVPLELEGRRFEAMYTVHSIPTIAVRVQSLCYSGDIRYDEEWFAELESKGVISPERHRELLRFAEGTSVLVQDVGGGAIHSTLTPRLLRALTAKCQRVVLAHTSNHMLPAEVSDLLERVEFARSGLVVAVGDTVSWTHEDEVLETLSASPLFARLPMAERVQLAGQVTLRSWDGGETIVQENDLADLAYIVHSGLVDIVRGDQLLKVVGRGTCVGERGVLHGHRRNATMLARGPVQLLCLDQKLLQPIATRLHLDSAFARTDWLAQHPAFRHVPWSNLLDLALEFEPRPVTVGDTLFRPGEAARAGYMLVAGAVSLHDHGQTTTLRQPGVMVGGRAALASGTHEAHAVMAAAGEVWLLPAAALQRLYLIYPHVLLHLRVLGGQPVV